MMTEKRQEQAEKLLQAAYDLVADVGVSGLRTRDIAKRAGVNLATLHYVFAGKDALLRALYHFIRARFQDEVTRYLEQTHASRETVQAQTDLRVHLLETQPLAVRVWRTFLGEAWIDPVVCEIVREHFAEQRARLAGILARERADGGLPGLPPADDRILAALLLSLYDGLLFQWAVDPDAFAVKDYAEAVHRWLGMPAEPEREKTGRS